MREGLRTLAALVDRVEGDGVVVDDVSLARTDGEELTAELALRFPAGAPAEPALQETDGGRLEPAYRGGPVTETATADPTTTISPDFGGLAARVGGAAAREMDHEALAAAGTGDGGTDGEDSSSVESYTCRVDGCSETFETEHGMKIHATKAHQAADGSAPSPHRNPERLREVYEACDTFDEMTEALDVDVTAQTVRRSMMSLGIHDPEEGIPGAAGPAADSPAVTGDGGAGVDDEPATSPEDPVGSPAEGETAATAERDDADEADVVDDADDTDDADETDGADAPTAAGESADRDADPDRVPPAVEAALPPAVEGEAFVAAVREAKTLYEVQRALDMERSEVQNLLAEFDLLDLVHGRVATEAEREERKAEIERRILEGAGDDADDDAGVGAGAAAHVDAE